MALYHNELFETHNTTDYYSFKSLNKLNWKKEGLVAGLLLLTIVSGTQYQS
jgi:hypothetical protein